MPVRAPHRLLCVLVALLFAISGAVTAYAATASMVQMPASASEGAMPSHDDGCDGKDKATHAACLAMCAATLAVLTDPAAIAFPASVPDRRAALEVVLTSRALSPEPPPPKC